MTKDEINAKLKKLKVELTDHRKELTTLERKWTAGRTKASNLESQITELEIRLSSLEYKPDTPFKYDKEGYYPTTIQIPVREKFHDVVASEISQKAFKIDKGYRCLGEGGGNDTLMITFAFTTFAARKDFLSNVILQEFSSADIDYYDMSQEMGS